MLSNYYILHGADPDSEDTKYNLVNTEPGLHGVRSVRTPYVYIKIRRGYPSLLYSFHIGNLDPHEG